MPNVHRDALTLSSLRLYPLALIALGTLPSAVLAQWSPHYSIQRLGLVAPEHTGSAGLQSSTAKRFSTLGWVLGTSTRYTGVSTNNGQDVWVSDSATTSQIGFTGGTYAGSAGFQYSEPLFFTNSRQAAGYSQRVTGVNTDNGRDAWIWKNGTTTQIGLTGAGHAGSAGRQYSMPLMQDANGQVAGYSERYTDVDTNNGRSAWVWNGSTTTQIGLRGSAQTGSTGYQFSEPVAQSATGHVVGTSKRFVGASNNNGTDAWVWDGTTTTQIGFVGGVYTGSAGFQYSVPFFQNASGHVAGASDRYTGVSNSNGSDAWIWNGTTTTFTGLTGEGYLGAAGFRYSNPVLLNNAGNVAGMSMTFNDMGEVVGRATWIWNGSGTTRIGLTNVPHVNDDGNQHSEPHFLNGSGQVVGLSWRFASGGFTSGQSAWVWNGTSTVRVGLFGVAQTGGSGIQYSVPQLQNEAGHAAGYSRRYTSNDSDNGRDAWVWNGSTTTQIGLTGPNYTSSTGRQYSEPKFQSAQGVVAGWSRRHTSAGVQNGQDAWYFDPSTGTTHAVIGSVRSSDNYAVSQPTVLTEDGFLLGNFMCFSCTAGAGQLHAFAFRPDLGFTDLGALVTGGLTSSGWNRLNVPLFSNAMNTIVGNGYVNGQTEGQSVFVMAAYPTCPADLDNGSGNGTPDEGVDISDLLFFLINFESGAAAADLDNGTSTGTPDGAVEISDLLYFIVRFEEGC